MRSRVIAADRDRVYGVVAEPDNLPLWSQGLATAEISRDSDDLVVESPMGEARGRFVQRNHLGVTDHDVLLPSGTIVTNPLRVLAHPHGSEVVFTMRQVELTDEEFERDCRTVAEDLDRLAGLVEG